MTEAQKEQRRYALAISGGTCSVCGKPLSEGQPQGAHLISNTQANRRKYGELVMDHPLNIAMVCSLPCNHDCDIGQNPGECLRLAKRIIEYELKRYGS